MPAFVYPTLRAIDAAADVKARRKAGAHGRGRRLLDQFLVTPLDRALALDERHHGSVLVAEQLHLDVPRPDEPPLEVHRRVAERRGGLRARGTHGARELRRIDDRAHALAAAAATALTRIG